MPVPAFLTARGSHVVEFQPMRGEQTLSWDFREISGGRMNTLFPLLREVTKMEEVLMETTAPTSTTSRGDTSRVTKT